MFFRNQDDEALVKVPPPPHTYDDKASQLEKNDFIKTKHLGYRKTQEKKKRNGQKMKKLKKIKKKIEN